MSLARQNQLVEEYLPVAGYITSEVTSSNSALDRDEIASVAFEALVLASRKFDKSRSEFGSFARYFIRHRVSDHLRATDTVGRRVRETVTESWRVEREMEAELGRTISLSEVAEVMGVSKESLQLKRSQSLGDVPLPAGVEQTLSDAGWDPLGVAVIMERTEFVSAAVQELPEALRRVVSAIFLEGLTVKEVAARLNVSHAAVSARKAEALELLRSAYVKSYDSSAQLPETGRQRVSAGRSAKYLEAVAERLELSPVLV